MPRSRQLTNIKLCLPTGRVRVVPIHVSRYCITNNDNQNTRSQFMELAFHLSLWRKLSLIGFTRHTFISFCYLLCIAIYAPGNFDTIFTCEAFFPLHLRRRLYCAMIFHTWKLIAIESDNTAVRWDHNQNHHHHNNNNNSNNKELLMTCDFFCCLHFYLIESEPSTRWKLDGMVKGTDDTIWSSGWMISLADPMWIGFCN